MKTILKKSMKTIFKKIYENYIQKIYENYIQKIYESYIQSIFTFVDSPGDQEIFSWWGGAENIYFLIDFQLEIRKVS